MKPSPEIFGHEYPPHWLPFGLCACASACAYAGTGGGVAGIGPACLVGVVTVTLFGVLHYQIMRAVVEYDMARLGTRQHTPEPEQSKREMKGWQVRTFAAETYGFHRDLVTPAIPDWMEIEDARQLALGIMLRRPLTTRQWSPYPYARGKREQIFDWLKLTDLAVKIGNTKEIEATQAGRTWARRVTSTYPAPLVRERKQ